MFTRQTASLRKEAECGQAFAPPEAGIYVCPAAAHRIGRGRIRRGMRPEGEVVRYEIDNSKRTLHGALLDAQILAEVYLAMTGGQTSMAFAMRTCSPWRGNAEPTS